MRIFALGMEQKRILIVDDEHDLCDILAYNLRANGYTTTTAHSAEEALKNGVCGCDLVLLDVMMPGMSGFDLAKQLKADPRTAQTPIIFLTAKDTEDDTLHGFGLGADDYISKPFSVREVIARVKAVLKRSTQPLETDNSMKYEGLEIDTNTKTITVDGRKADLTHTEYELLCLMLGHHDQMFTRQELLERVWPHDVVVIERTVDVNIARLRKKIDRYGACLISRTGFGYCFTTTQTDTDREEEEP